MPVNEFFKNTLKGGLSQNEFSLLQDLNEEFIKIAGYDVKYMPRTFVAEDNLFGQDPLSAFNNALDIEMYIKNVEGFEGEGDFLSRLGLEIRDQITFSVSRKRFEEFQDENLLTEVGYYVLKEDGDNILLEDNDGDGYSISIPRPREGDLIYFPLTGKIYEVKFVEHEDVFYQLGKLYTYDLRCELFEFSDQDFATGDTDIDSIETDLTMDVLGFEMLMESGDKVLNEDGDSIILESYYIHDTDKQANNQTFTTETKGVIDFSESNPFGTNRY